MKKIVLTLILTFGIANTASAAAVKLSQYDRFSDTEKTIYIAGVIDGIMHLKMVSMQLKGGEDSPQEVFCMPTTGVTFNTDLARLALRTFRDKKPQQDSNVGSAVVIGLMLIFPCK